MAVQLRLGELYPPQEMPKLRATKARGGANSNGTASDQRGACGLNHYKAVPKNRKQLAFSRLYM
jgi:hypothetical protein